MNKLSRLRRSRDNWKNKARERGEQLRESRKTKSRDCQRIERLQTRIETLEHQLEQKKKVHLAN